MGDIVLLGLRDFQDDKADVIFRYTPEEARNLVAEGELPKTTRINEEESEVHNDLFEFDENAGDEKDDISESEDDLPEIDDDVIDNI